MGTAGGEGGGEEGTEGAPLEGRAGAGGGGSVAPVAWAGQGVQEPVRGGDPADRGRPERRGGVGRDFA